MTVIRRTQIAAVILGVSLLAAAGCSSTFQGGTGPAGPHNCDPGSFRVHNVGRTEIIHGFVTVDCATAPQAFTTNATLQWATGARSAPRVWQNEGTGDGSDSIPHPDLELRMNALCAPGRWRILIIVSGTSSTGVAGGGFAASPPLRITNCRQDYDSGLTGAAEGHP